MTGQKSILDYNPPGPGGSRDYYTEVKIEFLGVISAFGGLAVGPIDQNVRMSI